MVRVIFISGACGCGKTTFVNAYSRYLVSHNHKSVYVIHGDDFHRGFVEPEDKDDFFVDGQASNQVLWEDILRFNWDCIIATAQRALFLKKKLEAMSENQGHIYNITGKNVKDIIQDIALEQYILP